MKAKLFRNGHIVSGKIAEVLINKGKAESVDEPEVLVTEACHSKNRTKSPQKTDS